jgi:hypothetical protein
MPSTTTTRRAQRAASGRYARGATHRSQGLRRRRPPQPTGVKKLLARLPGRAGKQAAPRSKKGKAGGLALAAAAAGVAFKYRDKLARRDGQDSASAPPSTPAV